MHVFSCLDFKRLTLERYRTSVLRDDADPPMITSFRPVVAADLHQVALLSVDAAALPPPTFVWYNGSTVVRATDRRVRITVSSPGFLLDAGQSPGQQLLQSTLNVSDVDLWDLSTFTCVVSNEYGVNRTTIQLVRSCKSGGVACHEMSFARQNIRRPTTGRF